MVGAVGWMGGDQCGGLDRWWSVPGGSGNRDLGQAQSKIPHLYACICEYHYAVGVIQIVNANSVKLHVARPFYPQLRGSVRISGFVVNRVVVESQIRGMSILCDGLRRVRRAQPPGHRSGELIGKLGHLIEVSQHDRSEFWTMGR